jgi:hypothetical protein
VAPGDRVESAGVDGNAMIEFVQVVCRRNK